MNRPIGSAPRIAEHPMSTATLIIPVHNRQATTLACLRHLRAQATFPRFDCIVVDDGSSDNTAGLVRQEFPEVTILPGDGSLWWTGGIAFGSAHAFTQGAAAVVWLNDDCQPEPGTLERLLAEVEQHPDAVVGPACVDASSGQPVASGFKGRRVVCARDGETLDVDGLSGFCVAVPRRVWETLGPPDSRRFPHYAGDTAYSLRASQAGFRVRLLGDARVRLCDHHPHPDTPTALRRPGRSWRADYRTIFLSNKSPFRLATQWHLLRLKYGSVIGSGLAVWRGLAWHLRFVLGF